MREVNTMAIKPSTQTTDYLTVRKGITINGTMTFGDASTDTLACAGAATFGSTVGITGAATLSSTLSAGVTTVSTAATNSTGALVVNNTATSGTPVGIKLDMASTGAAVALHIDAVATDQGPIFTDGVATDCGIDQVGAVIRITNGTTTYYLPCLTSFA